MTSLTSRPDFRDWLSPMLVKELRQGMRSRVFMSAFFLTQVLMILSTIFNLTASDDGGFNSATTFLNGLFWFMIAVPIVFLTPIRGFASLHGEIKEKTLELVFLTRLSAFRIAAGKWMALMVQALLLVCGVLPYVMLRYFLGGVNILGDLQSLLLLLVVAGVLTALTVAMSPYESKLLRGLLVIGLFIGFIFMLSIFIEQMAVGPMVSAGASSVVSYYLGMVLFVPALIILALEIGATRIAPSAENHAVRKRLISFYFILVGAGMILCRVDAASVTNWVLAVLVVVVIDALGESQEFNRIVYRPFLKRGTLGRALALFFTPGWVSAAWYVLLLAVICGAGLALEGQLHDAGEVLLRLSLLGTLIFPAALIRLVMPRTQHFLGLYIAVQFFCGAVTLLINLVSLMGSQPASIWLSPVPSFVFVLSLSEKIQPEQLEFFLGMTASTTGLSLLVLLARTFTPLRDIRASLRQNAGTDA